MDYVKAAEEAEANCRIKAIELLTDVVDDSELAGKIIDNIANHVMLKMTLLISEEQGAQPKILLPH